MAESILPLIARKRDGGELTTDEIEGIVRAITDGAAADYQIGALLMAIYLRGLNPRETADLTMAMVRSGDIVDLTSIPGFKIDKHSTGGVGDKVTLVLGPLVASAGVKFPKLSGRGLAHTGGTIDKLESIPGMRVDLSLDEFIHQVREIGLAVSGQTRQLVPADGIIYGMRDLTATVDSIPLIASSIMSKKIAAGADGIVIDVKCGRGAFMQTRESATELARQMVAIGRSAGKETLAIVTPMDQPLGRAVGNALEVVEAIDTLAGEGPEDLTEEVITLGSYILHMAGEADTFESASRILRDKIAVGAALEKLREMIEWQGGDGRVVDDPSLLPRAPRVVTVESRESGYVRGVDALAIGAIAMELGAGRQAKGEPIDHAVGVVLRAKAEDRIERGQPLAELYLRAHADSADVRHRRSVGEVEHEVLAAYDIGPEPGPASPTVLDIVGAREPARTDAYRKG